MSLHVLLIVTLGFVHVSTFLASDSQAFVVVFLVHLFCCECALTAVAAERLGIVDAAHVFGQLKSKSETFVAFTAHVWVLPSMGDLMLSEAFGTIGGEGALPTLQLLDKRH